MSTGLNMNTIPTTKIAYDGLRQCKHSPDAQTVDGPTIPWEVLKARLPRDPKVFVVIINAAIGDEAPFLRLLADLVEQLPGAYVVLRASLDKSKWTSNQDAFDELSSKVFQTDDEEEWAELFRKSSPDVVLTSQVPFCPQDADPKSNIRVKCLDLMEKLRREQPTPVYTIESTPLLAGCLVQSMVWREKIETGAATIQEYQAWCADPNVDESEIAFYHARFGRQFSTGVLAIQCYPAEMLTKHELLRVPGVVCGPIKPALSPQGPPEVVLRVIRAQRKAGKKVVLLVRGGLYVRISCASEYEDRERPTFKDARGNVAQLEPGDRLALVNDRELAQSLSDSALVIAASATGSLLKIFTFPPRLIALPYLDFDFAAFMPHVDLVVHHGGSGTTIATLRAGLPHVIIPNAGDCPDQMHHGARIAALGCGKFLAPYGPFMEKSKRLDEAVATVQSLLQSLPLLQRACQTWKQKLDEAETVEGVPVAVDAVRRLIASEVLARWNPVNDHPRKNRRHE